MFDIVTCHVQKDGEGYKVNMRDTKTLTDFVATQYVPDTGDQIGYFHQVKHISYNWM